MLAAALPPGKHAGKLAGKHTMTAIDTRARRNVATTVLGYADALAARVSDTVLLIGRLAMGIIFFQSGFAKLTGLGGFIGSLGNRGVPFPDFWGPVGAISEFTGGALIILGLGTRYAAALIVIFVIIATAISHRYWEFAEPARRLQQGQFYKNLAITGGALFLFICAAGRFSLDALLLKKR
jgi:putative oxidoreductase